jgi:hypothetical protein
MNLNNIVFAYTIVMTIAKVFSFFGAEQVPWLWVIGPFWIVTLGPWVYRVIFSLFFSNPRR